MSNRFHNKFHRHNHHTRPTDREGLYPDSAYDPIASAESPFRGEFYLDGDFIALSSVYINKTLSADYVTFNELTVNNLQVLGETTYLDTYVFATSALQITNTGTGPAISVVQMGSEPIAWFLDGDGNNAIVFDKDGQVGIGTTQPSFQLHVKNTKLLGTASDNAVSLIESDNRTAILSLKGFIGGNVEFRDHYNTKYYYIEGSSSLSSISFLNNGNVKRATLDADGKLTVVGKISAGDLIFQGEGNSADWNSVYSSNVATSANWDSVYSSSRATSATWDSVYSSNVAVSATWDSVYSSNVATSANWDSVYSSSRATSATWDSVYSSNVATSATWDSVYSSNVATSANWDSVYSSNVAVSATWDSVYSSNVATSANWDSVYSSNVAVSATWDSVYSSNVATSAIWDTVVGKLPLSGGTVEGATLFLGKVTIYGDLSATGVQTFANTVFSVTSAISVVHVGNDSSPALFIGSTGPGDIASFYDTDQQTEVLHIGGANSIYPNVGIKTSVPNKTLTVAGEISATDVIWDKVGNSANWNSVYSSNVAASANWDSVYSSNVATSATWDSVYSSSRAASATWDSVYSSNVAASATWDSVYSSNVAASANWNNSYTTARDLSANISLSSSVFADRTVGSITAGDTILAGTTLQVFVEKLLTATYYPTFTNPSATLTSNLASTVETGTTGITLTVNYNQGSINGKTIAGVWQAGTFQDYRAGAATNYLIAGFDRGTINSYTNALEIIEDGSNAFASTVTYAIGPQPVDSKGISYSTPLNGGSITSNLTVTGKRKVFYGINSLGDTSAAIRSLANSTLNSSNGLSFSITIPAGTTSVVFAYPDTLQEVSSVKESILNAEVKAAFTKTLLNVQGANSYTAVLYKVYRFVPVEPYSQSLTYTVTI